MIAAPVAAFAQSEQPVTRAEVKAEVQQLEQAGYNPATAFDAQYPADIQAAEASVYAMHAKSPGDTSGYGSPMGGSSMGGSSKSGHHPMWVNPDGQY
jgi:hypothetical protein